MKVNQKVVLPANMKHPQYPYRKRQKHSGPFLLPRVRFKKLRSSLNLSSLYLEMRLFFKRSWDRYQEILKRKSSKKFKMWAGIQGSSTGVYRSYMRSEDPQNDEPRA